MPIFQIDPDFVRLAYLGSGINTWDGDDWEHTKSTPYAILAQPVCGTYEIERGGKTAKIASGEVFVAPAHTPLRIMHRMDRRSRTMTARWLHVSFAVFDGIDLFSLYDIPLRVSGAMARRIGELIEPMLHDPPGDVLARVLDTARCAARVWPVVQMVCDLSTPRADAEELLRRTERLAPVLSYVRQNLDAPLTVPELAARAFMSPSGFYAYFKQHLGTTPLAYVKRVRLNHAGYQLAQTDLPLDAIAQRVGFANPFHLSREFKRQFGVTPSHYRKTRRLS